MIRVGLFLYAAARDLLSLALLAAVRVYQLALSPWLPKSCRYQPSCSEYAVLAIRKYGPLRGLVKSALRIGRCHPCGRGGFDPP
ncbi:putative membrane protein insertion efficiency factor [Botrimarina colliarenosi]|uniref:Putative membrane protein insertion efficiency factor n=1 Tax=Botrimarina colliarenosi TaxID=2528001 RepID=A0A5C6A7G9_9BACT|nr:membrane protein insertion efficiency factor YidD [Botrimarina colliarenosi]TWT95952.1 putative membrane protein insertion efficiency factor [Botrimarina colliarenosi]